MSQIPSNIDKSLEFISKTCKSSSMTKIDDQDNCLEESKILGKISTNENFRKNSVHDIQQIHRDDLKKILIDIQENLARLKYFLETVYSIQFIRDLFFQIKNSLFDRINLFIFKLSYQSTFKGESSIVDCPLFFIYSMEYFRHELLKALYLFISLTSSSSINSINFNTNQQDSQDIQQIEKDISKLDEHIYTISQRYYSQIPNRQDEKIEQLTLTNRIYNKNLSRFSIINQSNSSRSSLRSNGNVTFLNKIPQKCFSLCCFFRPNMI